MGIHAIFRKAHDALQHRHDNQRKNLHQEKMGGQAKSSSIEIMPDAFSFLFGWFQGNLIAGQSNLRQDSAIMRCIGTVLGWIGKRVVWVGSKSGIQENASYSAGFTLRFDIDSIVSYFLKKVNAKRNIFTGCWNKTIPSPCCFPHNVGLPACFYSLLIRIPELQPSLL